MVSGKLSPIYEQYSCSILSLFVVLVETRYYQHNYFWYYILFHYRPIHFKYTKNYLLLKCCRWPSGLGV